MSDNKHISFVIPCYRSEETISGVVKEIKETANLKTEIIGSYEIVLVNDGSPDNTLAVISDLARHDDHITVIDLAKNFGQHAALMAGLRQSTGEIVVCLDDDGQTPANEVDKLILKIDEGYDVVYASYEIKQHTGIRNLGSKMNDYMLRSMLNKPEDLYVSSYFAAKRFIIDEMIRYEHCYPYVMGLVLRSTKNICNVPVHHRSRESGSSGYSIGKLINLYLNGFTSFSVKPLRTAMYFGLFSAGCGFLYIIYIIINFFVRHEAPMGWSSTTAIMLLLGGAILIVLGFIGEYVGRIFMCTNATPQYVIKDVIRKKDQEQSVDSH